MSKSKKIIRNIIIIFIFIVASMAMFNLSLSPKSAYRLAERSLHYGPSEVVQMEDFDGGKFILGKYDKWYSCVPVERELLIFWSVGSHAQGLENHKTEAINFAYGGYEGTHYFYGIRNDDSIERVELTLRNGEVYQQTEFHDGIFLITIELEESYSSRLDVREIRGYDKDDNVIYESVLIRRS